MLWIDKIRNNQRDKLSSSLLLPLLMVTAMGSLVSCAAAADHADNKISNDEMIYLFPFFRGNGQHGVFLAAGDDGYHFKPINNDEPIMTPADWDGQRLTRDPSIIWDEQNEIFRMVWTSNWSGEVFGYAESNDLSEWSEPVMVHPFPDDLPDDGKPRNIWAPEIHYDPQHEDFIIVFSSTTTAEAEDDDGSDAGKNQYSDNRMYVVRTKDGETFTKAKKLIDYDAQNIDGHMVFDTQNNDDPEDDRWVMVLKQEHPDAKNFMLAMTDGPLVEPYTEQWTEIEGPIIGPHSPLRPSEWAEGPSMLKIGEEWRIYWDAYIAKHFSVATSTDLKTWVDRTEDLTMPPGIRHGTVFRVEKSRVASSLLSEEGDNKQ